MAVAGAGVQEERRARRGEALEASRRLVGAAFARFRRVETEETYLVLGAAEPRDERVPVDHPHHDRPLEGDRFGLHAQCRIEDQRRRRHGRLRQRAHVA